MLRVWSPGRCCGRIVLIIVRQGAVQHGRKGYRLNYTPAAPAGRENEENKNYEIYWDQQIVRNIKYVQHAIIRQSYHAKMYDMLLVVTTKYYLLITLAMTSMLFNLSFSIDRLPAPVCLTAGRLMINVSIFSKYKKIFDDWLWWEQDKVNDDNHGRWWTNK